MAIKERAETEIVLSGGQTAGKTINELTAQSVKLNREIKKLEVGSEEWEQKTADFKKINTRLSSVKKEVYSLDQAQKSLKDSFMEMLPFNAQLQQFTGSYKNLNAGVKATTLSTNLFSKALLATGIGAIVVALGALFTWLTKSQQGMDFLAKATDAAKAVFDVIIDRILTFAGALNDLRKGNFSAAVDGIKNSFKGLGSEIAESSKAAWKLTGDLQDITRAEKQLDLQRAKSRATIEALKLIAEDQTKSTQEREEAASKALKIEQDLMAQSIALQERKVAALKAQNEIGTTTDEDINKVIDAEIELANLREESTTKQIELNNKVNELRKADTETAKQAAKEREEAEKKAAEERKKAQEEFTEREQELQALRISLITDEQDRKLAQIQHTFEKEIAAFEGTEEQKTQFLILKQQERDAAIDAVIQENNKKAFDKNLERLQTEHELIKAQTEQNFYNGLIEKEERDQLLYEQEKKAIEDRLALMLAAGQTQTTEYANLYTQLAQLHYDYEANKTETAKKEAEARKKLEQEGLKAASDVFGGFADLLAQDEEARKKNWKMIKALKKAELLSNLPVEIQNIWKNANTFPVPFNSIIGLAQSGLALARFGQASAQLDKVKYARGGVVFGPSHTQGGIPISVRGSQRMAELEGNEIVLTKGVYDNPNLRVMASMINQLGGGVSFASAGPVNPLAQPSAPSVVNHITHQSGNGEGNQEMVSELRAMREELAGWQREFEVKLSVGKVRKGVDTIKEVELDAGI